MKKIDTNKEFKTVWRHIFASPLYYRALLIVAALCSWLFKPLGGYLYHGWYKAQPGISFWQLWKEQALYNWYWVKVCACISVGAYILKCLLEALLKYLQSDNQ